MMRTFAMTGVAVGALCLAATTAMAAETRVPTAQPQLNLGAGVTLPVLAGTGQAEKAVQLAQRRGRRAGRRGWRRGNRVRRRSRRGRRIRRGVAIGLGALALGVIASEAARANYRRGGRCGRWLRACENGSYRACRRYDRNC